ncbi:hypothetical protein L861_23100 [Litchfieldella anticariensis FP35 = DSM 16096]|uniref:Zn-binding Pro-Ala-Ala-Arg (PAAR) domain-containing protein, incolved in TypeVI secretion n=1 Tax=Litchfieldella anticariensis (strain DSM 16096 / CECT 5854 / CIP 108499 / LMG 22089 / FP35) TaxID=1121939 RepID=S2L624_LITA3|nr:PAAR domain-containing protein [Halomonas anticariensis]EPC03199.1 hypothetical protein L861_23100 [Halomonas anticariensis FP35 = DSM 16096]
MDLAKVGDNVVCSCKGGPHSIISGASPATVDGTLIARVGDKSSCGAAITSGASGYLVDGAPAAIHGSTTSCGGYVAAASSTITGLPTTGTRATAPQASIAAGSALRHVNDTSVAALAENNAETVYRYVAEETEIIIKQPAYLQVEGVEMIGGYSFRNHIVIRGHTLHISSHGWAPSTQVPGSGSAVFDMHAELKDGNQLLETAVLENSGTNAWLSDPRYTPIGHATLRLPKPEPARTLSLHLQGTFIYQTRSESVSPIPPSTSKTISIQVVAQ